MHATGLDLACAATARQDADPAPPGPPGMTLEALRAAWDQAWDVGEAGGEFCALHIDSGQVVTAATPGDLDSAIRLAAISIDYPGWHAWRSTAGRWWASRVSDREKPPDLPLDESVAWAMTVSGDDETQLRAALEAQESGAPPG
jgi:hypothetical protein